MKIVGVINDTMNLSFDADGKITHQVVLTMVNMTQSELSAMVSFVDKETGLLTFDAKFLVEKKEPVKTSEAVVESIEVPVPPAKMKAEKPTKW